VHEIAQRNGVNVVFSTFGDHSDKVAGFCDFASARIYVNKNDGIGRQMFTMAHELGHWILHRQFFAADPQAYAVLPRFQRPTQTPMETEANVFAAELLVPPRLLEAVKGAPVAALSKVFRVSREMMENRLKNV
jgi:Zn-dependent peptidase ImmA (M78 family)